MRPEHRLDSIRDGITWTFLRYWEREGFNNVHSAENDETKYGGLFNRMRHIIIPNPGGRAILLNL